MKKKNDHERKEKKKDDLGKEKGQEIIEFKIEKIEGRS